MQKLDPLCQKGNEHVFLEIVRMQSLEKASGSGVRTHISAPRAFLTVDNHYTKK